MLQDYSGEDGCEEQGAADQGEGGRGREAERECDGTGGVRGVWEMADTHKDKPNSDREEGWREGMRGGESGTGAPCPQQHVSAAGSADGEIGNPTVDLPLWCLLFILIRQGMMVQIETLNGSKVKHCVSWSL